jgi:hypothetical protein
MKDIRPRIIATLNLVYVQSQTTLAEDCITFLGRLDHL